jgi:hypothetical protein
VHVSCVSTKRFGDGGKVVHPGSQWGGLHARQPMGARVWRVRLTWEVHDNMDVDDGDQRFDGRTTRSKQSNGMAPKEDALRCVVM